MADSSPDQGSGRGIPDLIDSSTASDSVSNFFEFVSDPTEKRHTTPIQTEETPTKSKDTAQETAKKGAKEKDKPVSVPRDLPRQKLKKRLTFGSQVEEERAKIISKRQMCSTKSDMTDIYNEIDRYIDFAEAKGEHDIAIRFLLDKSVTAQFGMDFDLATSLADQALTRTFSLKSPDSAFRLRLVAQFIKTSVYNRTKDYGRAYGMLQSIGELIKDSNLSEDHFRFHYNMGTHMLAQLKMSSGDVNQEKFCAKGVKHFELCREAITDGESKGQNYATQEHFFALVMAAKMYSYLPEHKLKREHGEITWTNIYHAQHFLRLVLIDYSVMEMPLRFKLRFLVTFGGVFYRRGQLSKKGRNYFTSKQEFTDAILLLEGARSMANDAPYEELKLITEMLEFLQEEMKPSIQSDNQLERQAAENDTNNLSQVDSFSSEDFGNPGTSTKNRKKITRKKRTNKKGKQKGDKKIAPKLEEPHETCSALDYTKHPLYSIADSSEIKDGRTQSDSESFETERHDTLSSSTGSFSSSSRKSQRSRSGTGSSQDHPTPLSPDGAVASDSSDSDPEHDFKAPPSANSFDREICVSYLSYAKSALDFTNSEDAPSVFHRFNVTLANLKAANETIMKVKEMLPLACEAELKVELLLLISVHFYRSAQFAAQVKNVSTCKFCLNMAILYAEFAYDCCRDNRIRDRLAEVEEICEFFKNVTLNFLDKCEYSYLLS